MIKIGIVITLIPFDTWLAMLDNFKLGRMLLTSIDRILLRGRISTVELSLINIQLSFRLVSLIGKRRILRTRQKIVEVTSYTGVWCKSVIFI